MNDWTTRWENWKARKIFEINKFLNSWKFKILCILIGFGLAVALVWSAFMAVYSWTEAHKLVYKPFFTYKFMIPFRDYKVIVDRVMSPVAENSVEDLSKAELVVADKIRKEKEREAFIERLYQATRFLESRVGFDSDGTSGYCQGIDKVNEVGYFPEGNRKFCFKDEAEQKLTLTRWFSKKLDGMTAQEALCLYVTGTRQPTCRRIMDVGL